MRGFLLILPGHDKPLQAAASFRQLTKGYSRLRKAFRNPSKATADCGKLSGSVLCVVAELFRSSYCFTKRITLDWSSVMLPLMV